MLAGLGLGATAMAAAPRVAFAADGSTTPVLPAPAGITATHPADLSILEAASLLQSRAMSSREITQACLDRITKRDGPINSWVRTYPDMALALADAADTRLSAQSCSTLGAAPLLSGVPLGLKDLYAVKGLPLTASSNVLNGSSGLFPENVAAGDSTVWARLKAAGMPLLGHTHMSEFAFSTGTPQTGNPWDTTKSPGGSSGGSAAALAARMTPAACGSDTGGSLRLPSSACGTSTIKPTYGLVSTYGVIPLEWSYDNAGPMARSVADVALMLSFMAGADDADPATLAGRPPTYYPTAPRAGATPLTGVRIGVPDSPADSSLDADIAVLIDRARMQLTGLGATLVPITAPTDPTTTIAGMALTAEVKTFHSQFYPERAALYSPYVAEILSTYQGENPLATDYVAAGRFRAQYQRAWNQVFVDNDLDCLVQPIQTADTPTRSSTGELTIVTASGTTGPQKMWDSVGFPVVGLPMGLSTTGLPYGMQLIARPYGEADLLQIALDYQASYPYHQLVPRAWRERAGMSDPTGFDAVAPALLLTTGRMVTAADPTGFDAGAPAILLTTSRMTTDQVADPGTPPAGQQVCAPAASPASTAAPAPVGAAPTTVAPGTPGSSPIAGSTPPAPGLAPGRTPVPTASPVPRAPRPVIRVPPEVSTRGLTVRGGNPVGTVSVPARTLAFTGTTSLLADAATVTLGAALWLRRRASRPDREPDQPERDQP